MTAPTKAVKIMQYPALNVKQPESGHLQDILCLYDLNIHCVQCGLFVTNYYLKSMVILCIYL